MYVRYMYMLGICLLVIQIFGVKIGITKVENMSEERLMSKLFLFDDDWGEVGIELAWFYSQGNGEVWG